MKKVVFVVFSSLILFAGCSSGGDDEANNDEKEDRFDVLSSQNVRGYPVQVIKDKETGCQYARSSRGSVTPLYNADGTQICENEEEV